MSIGYMIAVKRNFISGKFLCWFQVNLPECEQLNIFFVDVKTLEVYIGDEIGNKHGSCVRQFQKDSVNMKILTILTKL